MESPYPDSIHPLTNRLKPKHAFIPSKWEMKRIAYLVQGYRRGWFKKRKKKKNKNLYDLWSEGDVSNADPNYLAAPKPRLPGHAESYNPSGEYLFDPAEKKTWKGLDPEDRKMNFIPKKYNSLREVPLYRTFIRERFERCLDLYLVPRKQIRRRRTPLDPRSLLPEIPKREDLRPFPNKISVEYLGHTKRVRTVSIDPTGHFIVSGSDDYTVRVWEISSGRCLDTWNVGSIVHSVCWCPNVKFPVVIVAVEEFKVFFINTEIGSEEQTEMLNQMLSLSPAQIRINKKKKSTIGY